jgi:endonuclease/exonuclease/phosphatase (EEP) superfamily protein YafD
MTSRIHRPLKILAFNANHIGRQRHELSKQLQNLSIDVALFSETHLKPYERFFITNYHIYRMDWYPGRKGGTAIAVKKGIPHNHVELPPLVSVEATWVCIPVGNDVVLLAAVYKSPGRPWNNTDILKLLGFKEKTILAGDLNAKHQFWNSLVSNPSGVELLELFHKNEFEISGPQCPTHYSPAGNGDILDIVVHQNIRLSSVTVSNILDSDHLPILFHILDHVKIRTFRSPLKTTEIVNGFKALPLTKYLPDFKLKRGLKPIKRRMNSQPLLRWRIGCRRVRLKFLK